MTRLTLDLRMYHHSGIGRYLRNLLPPLLPLLSAGRIRLIVTPNLLDAAPWQADPRLEFYETAAPVYSPQEQFLPLARAFRDTTLLWIPHYNAPLLYRGPLALTIHDLAPLALPEILSPLKRAYASLLIRVACARASAILSVSAFTAAELQSRLHVPAARITVTHQALDPAWPAHATPHQEPNSTPYLLFVGNVKPNKNLGALLTAFASVQDLIPHTLLLAGRFEGFGTGDDAVLRQARTLAPRVRFTGEIPDSELIALYAGASALVLPSLYEGFGLPVLEAMQLGCPVLCSNISSLPEIAANAALLFNPRSPEDCAATLLRVLDQPLMQSLATAGRRRAQEFTYAETAQRTAQVLNPLLH